MPVSVEWSEDGKQVLTYRMDRNGSYIWHGIQWSPPGSQMPREFDYVYPTAGAAFVPQINPVLIDVAQALAHERLVLAEQQTNRRGGGIGHAGARFPASGTRACPR